MFDVSTIVAQLSEYNNVLKNQLREICVNNGHKVLHSSVRATAKEYVPNDKNDKIELKTAYDEIILLKVENVKIFQMRK